MKRNWGLAAAIFGFIVLYQVFILGPYSKKQQAAVLAQTPNAAEATSSTAPTQEAVADPGKIVHPTTAIASPPLDDKPLTLQLGIERTVNVAAGGVVKHAVLEDFFPLHGKKTDKKELLPQGVILQSTNEKIQKCFLSMKRASEGSSDYAGSAEGGSCKLALTPDKDHRSVLNAELTLDGYSTEAGEFFLKFQDALGSTQTLDQNFLSYRLDGSKKSLRGKDLFKGSRFTGKLDWLAWGDRYFSTIFIPKGSYNPAVYVDGKEADPKSAESASSFGAIYPLNPEKKTGAYSYQYSFYFGTRDPRVLEDIDPVLADSVDLGFFAVIARVMLWLLHAFNRVFHNYGVSIIALTAMVRLMFWPLNRKAYASTIAMKNIQPEVNKIKERYGKDSSKAAQMNTEMMQLYKKNKVNPLGGCLPMLLQIPIFIGLYGALNHSIDLYGAPFFGWIQNLSDKDPYFVLPGLWTISLIGYMLLNPQTAQSQPGMPDMKWMFMGMNIFFGYLSSTWPAGLTLYLFVSNLVGVTQQVMMRRDTKKLSVIQEGAN